MPAVRGRLLEAGWTAPVELPTLDAKREPEDRIRAVASSDLSILAIPAQFGGLGGALLDVASAQRELGRRDPGVAIALNMHSLSVGVLAHYWERHRDLSWILLEGIAAKRALVASAFAEPGGSANFMRSRSVARPAGDGYVLSGTKFPCSLATTAEIYCVSAGVESTGDTIVALCPARSPGIRVEGAWTSIGMRGSDTAKVVFDEVAIDGRLVFHRAPAEVVDETVVSGVVWFSVLVAATYHGILTTLMDLAVEALRRRLDAGEAARHGQRTALLGEAAREAYGLGASCQHLAASWQTGLLGGDDALAAAMALRASMSHARNRVVNALTGVVGTRIYTEGDPLCRAALDSLACHHHPPNLLTCDLGVGASYLDQAISLDPS